MPNHPPPAFYTKGIKDIATDICQMVYWKFMAGPTIRVKWPVKDDSADPNDHYRTWLEENVGRQGWAWQWDIYYSGDSAFDLQIVLSRSKKQHATMIGLMWS